MLIFRGPNHGKLEGAADNDERGIQTGNPHLGREEDADNGTYAIRKFSSFCFTRWWDTR